MSVDFAPTCPQCGDDLVFQPQPELNIREMQKDRSLGVGDWQCPECKSWYDIPDNTPSHNEIMEMRAEQEDEKDGN